MAQYTIVPAESTMSLDAKSSIHPIHGSASGLTGTVEAEVKDGALQLDPKPTLQLSVPIKNMTSGDASQDREMQKLLNADRFPNIRAQLRDVQPVDGQPGKYRAVGDISIRASTQTAEGDLTIAVEGDKLRITGQQSFDIRKFGIEPPRILFFQVYPDVTVSLDLVAMKQT